MQKRALITGLTGFTGYYMERELLAAGYEVHGLVSGSAALPHHHEADLCDVGSVRRVVRQVRPHVVVHLAGIAFVGHGLAEDFYRVNLVGSRNLLEVLAEEPDGLDCVLLASSANVYGNRTDGVLTEEALPDPANDYAVSKLSMEYMARLWMPRLPIVITRPFNYTGAGQSESFLIPKIVSHFRRKAEVIELGNLDVWRDFSDVRTVASAYRGLVLNCPAGETFNVCSGKATSLREVLAMAERLTGHRIEVKVNPAFVRANEVKTLTGSAARLNAALPDWKTIDLQETLAWMCADATV